MTMFPYTKIQGHPIIYVAVSGQSVKGQRTAVKCGRKENNFPNVALYKQMQYVGSVVEIHLLDKCPLNCQ